MQWLPMIVLVPMVIFGLLYWSGKRFSPEKHARSTAKAMLAAYMNFEANHPELSKEELYFETLKLRPTFSDPKSAMEVMQDAKQTAREMNQPVRLWMVTLWTIMREYHTFRSRTKTVPGQIPHALEFFEQFRKGVTEVVPEDL